MSEHVRRGARRTEKRTSTSDKSRAQRPCLWASMSSSLALSLFFLFLIFSIPLLPAPRRLPSTFATEPPYLSLAQESSGRPAEGGRGRVGVEGGGRPLRGGCLAFGSDNDRGASSSSSAGSGGPGGARGAGQVGRAAQRGLHLLLVGRIQRAWARGGELRGDGE